MTYIVQFAPSADRDLGHIDAAERSRIIRKAAELAKNPRPMGVKKLSGTDDLYRIRVGNYRVIYQIIDRIVTVTVVRVGHRREVYRE